MTAHLRDEIQQPKPVVSKEEPQTAEEPPQSEKSAVAEDTKLCTVFQRFMNRLIAVARHRVSPQNPAELQPLAGKAALMLSKVVEGSLEPQIRLHGISGVAEGRTWLATDLLRIGRSGHLEIVLDDSSVSRFHAQVRLTEKGWVVNDCGSTNGSWVNGIRLGNLESPLRQRDILQFGTSVFKVEAITCPEQGFQNDSPSGPRTAAQFGNNEFGHAIVDGTEAIQLDPACTAAHGIRIWAYLSSNQLKLALDDCIKALRLDPSFDATWQRRCEIYRRRNELAYVDQKRFMDECWRH
jgi:hypothetical protein